MKKAYSIWLMPTGDIYNKLVNLIFQLSKKYSTPKFKPHVTLLSQVIGPEKGMIAKTYQLANLIRPYKIQLTTVGYLDEYFRCLFLKVKETEDVMDANVKAKEIFSGYIVSRHPDTKYIPHLSLMYGNLPLTIKEEIIAEIGKKFDINFWVRSIYLFFTDGEVKDWHKVKEFPLK